MTAHAFANVVLKGGPFDGRTVPVRDYGSTLTIESTALEPGKCARYRPSRERGIYTFRGMATVYARLPLPGGDGA